MGTRSCFIVGFPSAGKTSFLAALAYSLEQRETPTRLKWEQFSGNQCSATKFLRNSDSENEKK